MSYTNVSKPSTSNYTDVNPNGKELFDDPNVTFNASGTFFDGYNADAYTNISKPTSSTYTLVNKPT